MNNMYKAYLCVALIASLACVSFAMPTFESDYETSTVSGLKSFKKVYTENKNKNFDCDDVPQLQITIAYDDDYSVTMYPKDYVEPVVKDDKLKFKLNDDFKDYQGDAGVLVLMPQKLEKVGINEYGKCVVYEEVIEDDEKFEIDTSLGASVWVMSLPTDELKLDVDRGAEVIVAAKDGIDDLKVDLKKAKKSSRVFVIDAEKVEVDDLEQRAFVQLTGSNLKDVEVDDLKNSALYAEYNDDDDDDSEMEVDDLKDSVLVLKDCEDLEIDDEENSLVVTNNEDNCDDIDDDIECRVLYDLSTSEYNAIAIPTPPTDLTMYVDLTDLECGKDAFDKEYGF